MSRPPLPPSRIAEMFDRIHGRYDFLNRVLSLGLDVYWRRRAVREMGLAPGARVLDLCCGTGDLSQELTHQGASVIGVDFAAQMLDVARRKFPQLDFRQGDALAPPVEGPFDGAAMAFGPRNIHDLQALWAELRRLVRPGGVIMTLELTRPGGLLGLLHRFYLNTLLPIIGRLLSGDSAAYNYLSRTIAAFLDREQLSRSMIEGGLVDVRSLPLTGGIVTIHIARIPQ